MTNTDKECHTLAAVYRQSPTFDGRQALQRALSEAASDPANQAARIIWLYRPTSNTLGTLVDHWIVGREHVQAMLDMCHRKQPFPPMLRWDHPPGGVTREGELQRVEPEPPAMRARHG